MVNRHVLSDPRAYSCFMVSYRPIRIEEKHICLCSPARSPLYRFFGPSAFTMVMMVPNTPLYLAFWPLVNGADSPCTYKNFKMIKTYLIYKSRTFWLLLTAQLRSLVNRPVSPEVGLWPCPVGRWSHQPHIQLFQLKTPCRQQMAPDQMFSLRPCSTLQKDKNELDRREKKIIKQLLSFLLNPMIFNDFAPRGPGSVKFQEFHLQVHLLETKSTWTQPGKKKEHRNLTDEYAQNSSGFLESITALPEKANRIKTHCTLHELP